ncbi:ATP-binding protein [bacterium]|nr:ATP-binding protein [bacterium]
MSRSSWIWSLERNIPAQPDLCAPLIVEVLDALEKYGWCEDDRFAIRMALEEAIMNAIKHGNESDPSKLVEIQIGFDDATFEASVADRGCGFDIKDVPDPTADENLGRPCGRGVMLMKEFVDKLEFNDCGNKVKMTKVKSVS